MGLFGWIGKAAGAFVSTVFPPAAPVVAAVGTALAARSAVKVAKSAFGSDNSYDYNAEKAMRARQAEWERKERERQEQERERERQARLDREERERRERARQAEWERQERARREREAAERRRIEEEHQRQLAEERRKREEEERQREEALRQLREAQLREEARAREIEEMNRLMRQYRQSFKTTAASIERKSQQYIDIFFDALMQTLCRNDQFSNSYGIKRLERQHEVTRAHINGMIVNRIEMKISLDVEECAEIMRMPKDPEEKERRLNEYGLKIINEAKEELAQFVAETLRRQADDITDSVQNYLADAERKTFEAQRRYADWEHEKGNDTFDMEKAQLPARVKLYALDRVEEIVGGANDQKAA